MVHGPHRGHVVANTLQNLFEHLQFLECGGGAETVLASRLCLRRCFVKLQRIKRPTERLEVIVRVLRSCAQAIGPEPLKIIPNLCDVLGLSLTCTLCVEDDPCSVRV